MYIVYTLYIDFIYSTTMQILQLNQSNLLLTPLYIHKLQFFLTNCFFHLTRMLDFVSRTECLIISSQLDLSSCSLI